MAARLSRGDVWTAAGGADYAGKPQPVIIVQDNRFDATASITICPLTTSSTELPLFRPALDPTPANGLRLPCRIMVDKIATIPRAKLGNQVGRLNTLEIASLNRAILVFLGLAG